MYYIHIPVLKAVHPASSSHLNVHTYMYMYMVYIISLWHGCSVSLSPFSKPLFG